MASQAGPLKRLWRRGPLSPGAVARARWRLTGSRLAGAFRDGNVGGGPIMIMRITWGKLRAGCLQGDEQAYRATVAGRKRARPPGRRLRRNGPKTRTALCGWAV